MPCFAAGWQGSSAIHRHHDFKDALQHLPLPERPEINTLFKGFESSVSQFAANAMLGVRTHNDDGTRGEYEYETYADVAAKVEAIGTGMANARLSSGATVGVYSINRPEWIYAALSIWRQGCTVVPLYDTLGATAVEYILQDAGVSLVFVAKANTTNLLGHAAGGVASLKTIVQFEAVDAADVEQAKAAGVTLVSLADFMAVNTQSAAPVKVDPESLAYIMYTSGTTGNPKGVLLTHKNILAAVTGLKFSGVELGPDDVYFRLVVELPPAFKLCFDCTLTPSNAHRVASTDDAAIFHWLIASRPFSFSSACCPAAGAASTKATSSSSQMTLPRVAPPSSLVCRVCTTASTTK